MNILEILRNVYYACWLYFVPDHILELLHCLKLSPLNTIKFNFTIKIPELHEKPLGACDLRDMTSKATEGKVFNCRPK